MIRHVYPTNEGDYTQSSSLEQVLFKAKWKWRSSHLNLWWIATSGFYMVLSVHHIPFKLPKTISFWLSPLEKKRGLYRKKNFHLFSTNNCDLLFAEHRPKKIAVSGVAFLCFSFILCTSCKWGEITPQKHIGFCPYGKPILKKATWNLMATCL